ncbi:MAG: insulinase family protein, partial [bacterium]|nr:insulinase family protein [bacterium]
MSLQGLIRTGRIDDPVEASGLGNFAIDMLSAGTITHDKFQLAALLEDNGIELGISPGRETLGFSGRALAEDFGILIDALAEMLLRSSFPAE